MNDWLMQEGALDLSSLQRSPTRYRGASNAATPSPLKYNLAVLVKKLVVRQTGKWFGDADIRLDALVVHGGTGEELYHPQTFRFPRVADGDDLAGEDPGLLIYLGRPAHFLTFSLMLARDTKDSDDLAALVRTGTQSPELGAALSTLATGSMPSLELAGVQAALGAAFALGDFAYKAIREISPRCLGLFRANWLGETHRFGVGRHPRTATHQIKDFEVSYEIMLDSSE